MVGGLTECIGVGQRVAVRSVLCLYGDVTLTDLCLQAGVLVVHFLLRVVVGEVHAGGVDLLPVIYWVVVHVVDGYPPIGCVLSLLG